MRQLAVFVLVFALTCLSAGWTYAANEEVVKECECFATSLHHTTRGMSHWYDASDGFSAVTGVPYKDLGCKGCHVASCNDCHLKKTDDGLGFSLEMARQSETCLKCHAREKATLGMDKAAGTPGVHMGFLACADCHTAREVHGDGNCYDSMRAPGAMDAKCTNCHKPEGGEYTPVPASTSHKVHKDKLDCTACHVSNTMTCYNCHFGVLKETGKKSESFAAKAKDFLLLVKFEGRVTSGTLQTLVGPDNYPFVTYVPYFTHSIMPQGRKCEECHATDAVNVLAKGGRFAPGGVENGKLVFYKGVIPLVPDRLDWPFLEKKGKDWTVFAPDGGPMIQLGVYAEPLSDTDLKKMNTKQTYKQ